MSRASLLTFRMIFSSMGCLVCLDAGQSVPADTFRHNMSWNYDIVQLPQNVGGLLLDLGNLDGVDEWILGVKARAGQPRLVAGEGRFLTPPAGIKLPVRMIERIDNLPRNLLSINSGGVALRRSNGARGPLVVFLWLPTGGSVTVRSSAGIVATLPVGDGFVLHNGKVVPVAPVSPATLVSYLQDPSQRTEARDQVIAVSGGRYVATVASLKSHLVHFSMPTGSLRVAPGTVGASVTLSLEISEAGSVASLNARPGAEVVLALYGAYIKSWRFKPFTVNERPVRVSAPLSFVVTPSGVVAGPLGLFGSGAQADGDSAAASCCEAK